MATLPQFQGDADKALQLMQNKWAAALNPILGSPLATPVLIPSVSLASGDNTINHRLGRNLRGWLVVRKRAAADIYDKQDSNTMPNLTLVLNSSATCVVDLLVF